MDAAFWHQRWEDNQIGFNQKKPNPLLVAHFDEVGVPEHGRVFVPLCGKTIDLAWLMAQGFSVVGVELSELAIVQLFEELQIEPDVESVGNLKRYHASNIDVFVGDLFELSSDLLGHVDAIYDRAALVALPPNMRIQYAKHLTSVTSNAPQFAITFEYDQQVMDGPPFSIPEKEVRQHYAGTYALSSPVAVEVKGGLKGICPATEIVWIMNPIQR